MNIWEQHAKRRRRQEDFRRLDVWFEQLYRRRPFAFNLLCAGLAIIFFFFVMGATLLLEKL